MIGCSSSVSQHFKGSYVGVASWYGPKFHGKRTASGEIFNMYDYTAAHKFLPFNTKVCVRNLLNNKSVVVRINDRGPFVKDRVIDLSYAAAKKIGLIKTGTAPVELKIVSDRLYYVQVGCFSYRRNAVKIANELKRERLDSFIITKSGLWCVRIGPYFDMAEVKSLLEKIKKYYSASFILCVD